jgi:hypothetical protein
VGQRLAELDVRYRLLATPLIHEGAPERVVSELVVRGQLDERPELGFCLLPAADPEVRDPERLTDRARLRLGSLRLLERDRRLRGPSAAQMAATELEEVVGLGHRLLAVRSERNDTSPRKRAQIESSRLAA